MDFPQVFYNLSPEHEVQRDRSDVDESPSEDASSDDAEDDEDDDYINRYEDSSILSDSSNESEKMKIDSEGRNGDAAKEAKKDRAAQQSSFTAQSLPCAISEQNRCDLIDAVIQLISQHHVDKNSEHALLRMALRLTKDHSIAARFLLNDGLDQLLHTLQPQRLFQGFTLVVMLLVRHAIEDKTMLEALMIKEVAHWFKNPRSRGTELPVYFKTMVHLAYRNPEMFLKVTAGMCRLKRDRYNGYNLIQAKAPVTSHSTSSDTPRTAGTKTSSTNSLVASSTQDNSNVASSGADASVNLNQFSETQPQYHSALTERIVHFLLLWNIPLSKLRKRGVDAAGELQHHQSDWHLTRDLISLSEVSR